MGESNKDLELSRITKDKKEELVWEETQSEKSEGGKERKEGKISVLIQLSSWRL